MQLNIADAARVLTWMQRIYSLLGLWPLKPNDFVFSFFYVFLIVHLTLEWAQVLYLIEDLQSIVTNVSEIIIYGMIFCKLSFYRLYRDDLGVVIKTITRDFDEKRYNSIEEKKVYFRYITWAGRFIRIACPLIFISSFLYYSKPLVSRFGGKLPDNATSIQMYPIPYRTRVFYTMTPVKWLLTYIGQSPIMIIVTAGYTGSDCLLVTVVLHVCGQLAALGSRIRAIDPEPKNFPDQFKYIVDRHLELIRVANKINEVFKYGLLLQLLGTTVLLCFTEYRVIQYTSVRNMEGICMSWFYISSLTLLFFGYCFAGDSLMYESRELQEALYNTRWYDMQPNHAKSLILCMARAKIPLQLNAGGFYVFNLAGFNDVIKTSMAYLSVLRTIV